MANSNTQLSVGKPGKCDEDFPLFPHATRENDQPAGKTADDLRDEVDRRSTTRKLSNQIAELQLEIKELRKGQQRAVEQEPDLVKREVEIAQERKIFTESFNRRIVFMQILKGWISAAQAELTTLALTG